jgi:hypothetical protein
MKPIKRPSSGYKYNIKIELKQRGYEHLYWIHPARDMVQWLTDVSTGMKPRVP